MRVRDRRAHDPGRTDLERRHGPADEAIGDALTGAELTVDELTEAIAERTGPWAVERTMEAFQDKWPRWRQLTSTAAHRGVLCFGADRGRKVTYTNPHRWLPGFRPADGGAALGTLVARYLYAYGPATSRHFARWLGGSRRQWETSGVPRGTFVSAHGPGVAVIVEVCSSPRTSSPTPGSMLPGRG